mgnify:CR=1 FL=1
MWNLFIQIEASEEKPPRLLSAKKRMKKAADG